MRLTPPLPAIDFEATTLSGRQIHLSEMRGKRILLSFFRNGACALCNLRVHELSQRIDDFAKKNIQLLGVFESSREDMLPYVGQQRLPFELITDPEGKLYDLYQLESSKEKIDQVIASGVAKERIESAAALGYQLTHQQGSNFFRLPADFLIDEEFIIEKAHYSDHVIDHIDINTILVN